MSINKSNYGPQVQNRKDSKEIIETSGYFDGLSCDKLSRKSILFERIELGQIVGKI